MSTCTSKCRDFLCIALCCGKNWWKLLEAEIVIRALSCRHCNVHGYKTNFPEVNATISFISVAWNWLPMSAPEQQHICWVLLKEYGRDVDVQCPFLTVIWNDYEKSITNQLPLLQTRIYSMCSFCKVACTSIGWQLFQNKRTAELGRGSAYPLESVLLVWKKK